MNHEARKAHRCEDRRGTAVRRLFATLHRHPWLFGLLAAALIGAALVFQYGFGYAPCELCHWQRYPYYALIALTPALLSARGGGRAAARLRDAWLLAAAIAFLGSGAIGVYHAGVELHWWAGPSQCTGALSLPADPEAALRALAAKPVVRCDQPALLIFGLSMAAWNALIGLAAGLAALLALTVGARGRLLAEEDE